MSETEQPQETSPAGSSGKTGTEDAKTTLESLRKKLDELAASLPETEPAGEAAGTGDSVLVGLVGNHALDRAGAAIAGAVSEEKQWCPELNSATVLIVERSDLAAWEQSYLVVMKRLSLLEKQLVQARTAPGMKLAALPALLPGIVGAASVVESVAGIAVAVGKCIAYFTPKTTVRGVPIALGTGALAVAVAGRLRTETRSVRLLRHQATPGASALTERLESIVQLSARLARSVSGAGALTEFLPAGERGVADDDRAADSGPEAVEPAGTEPEELDSPAGPGALLARVQAVLDELAAQGSLLNDAFSWEMVTRLGEQGKYTHLLCLDIVSSGGTVITDTGPLGTRTVSIAGCAVAYSVLDTDRTVCLSALLPVVYAFHCSPSSPGEGSLTNVAMTEEQPVNPSWMV